MTAAEIAKIEKRQREINNDISKLQAELNECRNSIEVKAVSEKIIDPVSVDG